MSQPSSAAIVKSAYETNVSNLRKAEGNLAKLLAPYNMTSERFVTTVLECLRVNPILLECPPQTILRAAYYAAQIGLELGGPLGDAYLVPFYNKRTKRKEAKCIPGYRGLVHVATEADPEIDHFDADVIYANDEYTEERGDNPIFRVIPARFSERGERQGAYAICYWRPAQYGPRKPLFTVMRADEIEAIKRETLDKLEDWQKKTSPWTLHEDEMWKKSALRRIVKLMNLRSTRARLALDLDAAEHREQREQPRSRAEDLKAKLGQVPPEADVPDAEFEVLPEDKPEPGA